MSRKNISDDDLNLEVIRYLSFSKFISLVTYSATWFSKLNILEDPLEGNFPKKTKQNIKQKDQDWKKMFTSPEHHKQIDHFTDDNQKDGRELSVVNCWYLSNVESKKMWDNYGGDIDGIAIKSTIKQLMENIFVDPRFSTIGRIQYVDMNTHEMEFYEADQAQHRALLKDLQFSDENEIRIVTLNLKSLDCVKMDGLPMGLEDCSGPKMNNFENPGLYIGTNLSALINGIILAPNSSPWMEKLVTRIAQLLKLDCTVEQSKLI